MNCSGIAYRKDVFEFVLPAESFHRDSVRVILRIIASSLGCALHVVATIQLRRQSVGFVLAIRWPFAGLVLDLTTVVAPTRLSVNRFSDLHYFEATSADVAQRLELTLA